jgi:DNA-binding SARP family transcriptional activator
VVDAPRPPFRLLGRLEVGSDEAPVRVGGRLRRSLLAFMLVHAERSVPLDVICDRLWDGEPPRSARATVRTYVSQFRRITVAGFSIAAQRDGQAYRVQLDRSQLDAFLFEDLVADATRQSDHEHRGELLEAALSLWRGEALSEFLGSAWADDDSRRLAAVHRRAAADRFALLVELGRIVPALPQLESAVVAEPFDERLAMLLAQAR